MEREQRFSLAISLQNLKENKCIVLIILGLLSLVGLYLGYPVFVVKETNHVTEQLSFLKNLVQPSRSTFNVTTSGNEDLPQTGKLVKWGFDSMTPSSCSEDHVIDLERSTYLTVCDFKSNIIIDIRKFTGNSRVGITPTILGIGLNVDQWGVLTKYITIIDKYISDLS